MVKTRTSFKRGNRAGVGKGRPKLTKDQKAIRHDLKTALSDTIQKYQSRPLTELKEILDSNKKTAPAELKKKYKDLPALHIAVVSAIAKGMSTGDYSRYLEPLFSRVLGKPKTISEIDVKTGDPITLALRSMNGSSGKKRRYKARTKKD